MYTGIKIKRHTSNAKVTAANANFAFGLSYNYKWSANPTMVRLNSTLTCDKLPARSTRVLSDMSRLVHCGLALYRSDCKISLTMPILVRSSAVRGPTPSSAIHTALHMRSTSRRIVTKPRLRDGVSLSGPCRSRVKSTTDENSNQPSKQ
jgi:hypothetical protein